VGIPYKNDSFAGYARASPTARKERHQQAKGPCKITSVPTLYAPDALASNTGEKYA